MFHRADEEVKPAWEVLALVKSDGMVHYIPHIRVESICALDLKHFPYDTQVCEMKFGSWVYHEASVSTSIHL